MATRSKRPKRQAPGAAAQKKPVRVVVSVHEPGGKHFAKPATLELTRSGKTVKLKQTAGKAPYEGEVKPGTYTLKVTAPGMGPSKREVEVPREGQDCISLSG